jgi:hypothetical protein
MASTRNFEAISDKFNVCNSEYKRSQLMHRYYSVCSYITIHVPIPIGILLRDTFKSENYTSERQYFAHLRKYKMFYKNS